MNLEGKIALITGGGRRLGRAISQALASSGCRVALHYGRSREEAEATAGDLRDRGVEAICIGADLRHPEQIDAMFEAVERQLGGLDVLVNSAASFLKRPLAEIEPGDWDRVFAVNLRAPMICLQRASSLMRQSEHPDRGPAAVINIGDLSGVVPWPGYSYHGASKAALLHLTRVAARELAPAIRVNAVIPGPILPPPGAGDDDPAWQDLIRRVPMARSGRPAEIGDAVVFLAQNDYVTGETITIDGGEHLLGAGHRGL